MSKTANKTAKKKREAPVSYRPPAELREQFFERVNHSGKTVSGFITDAVFGQEPSRRSKQPSIQEKLLAKLLARAAKISMSLDHVNAASPSDESCQKAVLDAHRELVIIRAALLKSMGRKP